MPSSKCRFSHVGVNVRDIDAAVAFYRVLLEEEPITSNYFAAVPFIDEIAGYDGAHLKEVVFPFGDGYLELQQYTNPTPGQTDPETYNVGHMHLCIEVDDIDAEVQRLKGAELGIEFRSSAPVTVPESFSDFKGERYIYLRTPDGSTLELFQRAPDAGQTEEAS